MTAALETTVSATGQTPFCWPYVHEGVFPWHQGQRVPCALLKQPKNMAKNNASHAKRTRTRPPKTSMTRRRCPKPTTTDRNSVYAQQAHAERDSKLREVIGPRNEPIHIALELSLPLHKSCTANLDVVSPADGVDLRLLHHHNFIPWKSPFPNALGARGAVTSCICL